MTHKLKRVLLFITFISCTAGYANAQELLSKNGTPILPEAKDIGISIDASPLGTFFRNSGSSALSASYLAGHSQTIAAKLMINSSTAFRCKIRIGFDYSTQDSLVQDRSSTDLNARVTDETKNNKSNIAIGFGIQKYRGKGRLRGFFGGEAMISLASDKTSYTYGNELNSTNYPSGHIQNTEVKRGSTFGFGLRGFLGAEYFFAAKMSLGMEYGWGFMVNSTGLSSVTDDNFDTTVGIKPETNSTGKSSDFNLDVDNAYGAIMVSLYF